MKELNIASIALCYFLRCVHRLHSKFSTSSNCVFNRQGTRILGGRVYDPFMMVFDVPTVSGGGDDASKMYHLSTQGYSVSGVGRNKFCFAGKDDELVVSSSADNNLYVWSLPENQERAYQTVNSSLHVLRDGHKDAIYSVRYDHCSDTLASAGAEKTIKLWTPVAQQWRFSKFERQRIRLYSLIDLWFSDVLLFLANCIHSSAIWRILLRYNILIQYIDLEQ